MIALAPPDTILGAMQASLTPVTVISGVGLLLGAMNNRYGRVIDRTRDLLGKLQRAPQDAVLQGQVEHIRKQIRILFRRARLLRLVIMLASFCIFSISLTIVSLFSRNLYSLPLETFGKFAFLCGVLCLVASIALFIRETGLSLRALKMEISVQEGLWDYVKTPFSDEGSSSRGPRPPAP